MNYLRPTLKPRAALPHVDRVEHAAWQEGWFTGIAVGFILGFGAAVIVAQAFLR